MQLITLYAQKQDNKDVHVFEDKEATKRKIIFPWDTSGKYMTPRQGQRIVTINCWNWNLIWI